MKKFIITGFRICPKTGKAIYFGIDQQTGEEKLAGFYNVKDLEEQALNLGYKVVR